MQKLDPATFAALAILKSNASADRLSELSQQLDAPTTWALTECRATVRRLIQYFRLPEVREPLTESRVRWATHKMALAEVGCTSLELAALAADEATVRFPADFGAKNP